MKQFEHNILLGLGTNFFSSLPAAMPVIILTVILVSNGFSIKLFNVCNLLSLRNNSLSTHIFLSHSKLDYIISMVTSSNRPECWEEKELSGCLAERHLKHWGPLQLGLPVLRGPCQWCLQNKQMENTGEFLSWLSEAGQEIVHCM